MRTQGRSLGCYATDVVLQAQSEASGHCSLPRGVEPATSRLPSATTTSYAKEKLAICRRGWPIKYLRSEFHLFTPVTLINLTHTHRPYTHTHTQIMMECCLPLDQLSTQGTWAAGSVYGCLVTSPIANTILVCSWRRQTVLRAARILISAEAIN